MFKRFVYFIFFAAFLLPSILVKAQDPHFSQFYANPLYLNPAFAGTSVCPRLIMNYRNQWPGIPGSYVTYNAGFDMHFDALSGGVGVLATSDRAGEGILTSNFLALIYSYRLTVSKTFSIKAGFQGSYFNKSVNTTKLTFGDQINPRWGFVEQTQEVQATLNRSGVDFSTGLLGFSENFYFGLSAHHLTQPNESFFDDVSALPMRLTLATGGIVDLKKNGKRRRRPGDPLLSPNIIFMQQGNFHQINYGLYLNKQPMIFGLWFRQFFEGYDALIILAGFQYDQYKFAYSYDITLGELGMASGGAHEISFALMFNCPQKKRRLKEINCPSF